MGGRGKPMVKIPVRQVNKELQAEMREEERKQAEEARARAAAEAAKRAAEEAKKKAAEEKKAKEEAAKKKAAAEKKKQQKPKEQPVDFNSSLTKSQAKQEFVDWFNKQKSTKQQFTKIKPSDVEIDNQGNITAWTEINSKFAKTREAQDMWIVGEDVKLFFKAGKKKGRKKFSFDFEGSKQ